jgi:hypothetical protein
VSADFERLAERVAAELRRRVQTVHKRQPCPRCGAPVDVRCRSMPAGWRPSDERGSGRPLKHPHAERLRADGIADR